MDNTPYNREVFSGQSIHIMEIPHAQALLYVRGCNSLKITQVQMQNNVEKHVFAT